MLAIDVSPGYDDADTSTEWLFCHTYGHAQIIPAGPTPSSRHWTVPLDVVRVSPDDAHPDLATTQLRTVATG